MRTTVTELPESRVRVEAEVPADEVEGAVTRAAKEIAKGMKMPGFRQGKIPPAVVVKRVGREALLDEAIRGSLGRWYVTAVDESGIHPVGDPDLDLGEGGLPAQGEPLTFSFEIGVRPTAKLGDYKGLEVGRTEPEPDDAAVQAELDQLRERSARLETVEEAAAEGDFVVMDYLGTVDGEPFEGGEGRDQMIELGSGRLIPGFEEQLTGASAGDERTVKVRFPDDYGAEHLAAKDAEFAVTVKEVKRKQLPALDDAFAEETAGFDTLDELREDIAAKLRETAEAEAESAFREAVLDAVVDRSTVEVPEALVRARAGELWERMNHSLSHQGSPRRCTCRSPARPRRRSSRRRCPTPSARSSARRCSPPSSRPRASRPPTATCSTRCRPARPRGHGAREAARPPREGRPSRRPARGPRPARGDRPARRARHRDRRGQGGGPREDLDAREGLAGRRTGLVGRPTRQARSSC